METLKKFKTLIIVVVVVIIAFIAYSQLKPASPTTGQSSVVRQTGTTGSTGATDGPSKGFATQLLAIQNIKFKTTLFSDQVYLSLDDFSRDLIPQPTGRPNPFAPLGQNDIEFVSTDTSSVTGTGFTITSQGTTTPSKKAPTNR